MKVENVKNSVSIGLGVKGMPLYESVGQYLDSYAYESNGTVWVNGTPKKGKEQYTNGDVVGFGVNLITRRIITTKNGLHLDTAHLFLSSSSSSSSSSTTSSTTSSDLLLFPCVTLSDCGDKIEANFGSNFQFDPANAKLALADQLGSILDRMEEKQQQKYEESEKSFNDKFSQLHNEQKTLLGEIGELKKAKDTDEQQQMKFSNLQPNCWKTNCCPSDLEILGNDCLMVHYKESGNGFNSVFAKCSITMSEFGICYYEMKVENVKNSVSIGLGTKTMPSYRSVGHHLDSCAYESNGTFLVNGTSKKGKEKYTNGDVVGFGINLVTRRIICTKNGLRLDTAHLFLFPSSSSDLLLFPCVTLSDCGDKIEANFGPNFKFDPANAKFLPKFPFNYWDVITCHDDLAISGPICTVVQHKENVLGWRTVFAKYCILDSIIEPFNIFYFELNVRNVRGLVTFGFAVKHQTPLDEKITERTGTYAYEDNGFFWINGSKNVRNERFDDGDTVGCGVNLAKKQLFFTKNGRRIDGPSVCLISSYPSADLLFPFVSLRDYNDRIDANFGLEFMFDLSTNC